MTMITTTTTSSFTISFSSLTCHRTPFLPSPHFPLFSHFKKGVCRQRFVLKVKCEWEGSKVNVGSEPETTSSSTSSLQSSSSSFTVTEDDRSSAAYKWCAALGGIGFLETAYLTYLKVMDSDAFCSMGGGSCNTILISDFSSVFGIPLPLFGMLAYGLVATVGLHLSHQGLRETAIDIEKADGEMILIGTTSFMAVASAYFLYILSTEFVGESCLYCLTSATLSFSLFFITLKNFRLDKIKEMFGSQLCMAILVIIASTASYNVVQPISPSLAMAEMPYAETEITKESSPLALSLARHLHSIGAKLYGAFWCSHCVDQKQMFGHDAAKLLDYVECFPDGVREGTKMANACYDVNLKGFPSWEINGQVFSGRKQFPELARLSGIELEDLGKQN